jgi:hypothetical protein
MPTRLYIAIYQSIYYRIDPDKHHWCLVVLRPKASLMERVRAYQIKSKPGSDQPWLISHEITKLISAANFYGCIYLGETTANKQELEETLETASPEQGDTPLLPTHQSQGRGWSCAQWLIRFLQQVLVAKGKFTMIPSDSDEFYRRVVAIGRELRAWCLANSDEESITVDGQEIELDFVNGVITVPIF